jgi:hypothetical protein
MGTTIYKQPDGLFCRYSTVIEDFTHINLTREALFAALREIHLERWEASLNQNFDRAEKTGLSARHPIQHYDRFDTLEDKIKTIEDIHGVEYAEATAKALGFEKVTRPKGEQGSAEAVTERSLVGTDDAGNLRLLVPLREKQKTVGFLTSQVGSGQLHIESVPGRMIPVPPGYMCDKKHVFPEGSTYSLGQSYCPSCDCWMYVYSPEGEKEIK